MPRLILFEFHLLGDAIMSLPFLNGARKKYDVYVCCSPGAARIYELVVPADRLIVLKMPALRGPKFSLGAWADYLKTLGRLRRLHADIGVTVWADVRVHLLMILLGVRQRVGFPMNEINYYAHELPVRKKNLHTGEKIQHVLQLLHLKALTTVLQRPSYRQHHVEDWQQIGEALGIPWEIDPAWLQPGPPPAGTEEFLARHAGRKIWFLHPGAGKEIRRWPHFELMVSKLFAPRNVPLIILDDPASPRVNVEYENCLHWPMGTLADFFALAARCDFLLCNDTAAAHVGTALRKHVVTIFGPGSSDWFAPYTRERTVIESFACPYRPCLDNCVQPTLVCLNDVTPDRVAGQLEKLLARRQHTLPLPCFYMKIAILGLRGLPSTYSGYEAFLSELGPRLAARGHEVTVYCRKSLFPEQPPEWEGVKLRYIPSIEHKVASTLSHSLFSICDASFGSFDVVFVVNAANGMFGLVPRLLGKPSVLNVDGMEWLRPKWNSLAKFIFKNSARLGCLFYDRVVTDAEEMHRLYAQDFGINTDYIAYGANIESSTHPEVLQKYGLEPRGYYLIASRLVPDNNADLIVESFVKSNSPKILAIAGGADYRGNTVEQEFLRRLKASANDRVKFLGHVGSSDEVKELHCNCHAYVHGHQFGGINPSLLKALGFGNLVLAYNTPFNSEVLEKGRYGMLWEKNVQSLSEIMLQSERDPAQAQAFRDRAPDRIRDNFSWDKITTQYEELFDSLWQARGRAN